MLSEQAFNRMLHLEQKRIERSRRQLLLMLVNVGKLCDGNKSAKVIQKIIFALSSSIRETDISGWYKQNSVMGVILTEISAADQASVRDVILTKLNAALSSSLDFEQISRIQVSFHFLPEDTNGQKQTQRGVGMLCPLPDEKEPSDLALVLKRAMDVAGSLLALLILLPLFLAIALLIKRSSKGPVIFRQERVGYRGQTFVFLKFRSMYSNNDDNIHREYVNRLITRKTGAETDPGKNGVYKITDDPRVTPIGRFLRRTSFDELPQFINVLKGEMSLVGPRPPIQYEFDSYDYWHRRRVLAAKPGITGLWQVKGRSKTTFDDMVRLDLRYARAWSLWLDLKILIKTPLAIFTGAY